MTKLAYTPEEPFLLFYHCGEWDSMTAEFSAEGRPHDVAAGMVWCRMSGRSAEEWRAELSRHEVPGAPWASWDRVAAHMVWVLLGDAPRLRSGERQGDFFA